MTPPTMLLWPSRILILVCVTMTIYFSLTVQPPLTAQELETINEVWNPKPTMITRGIALPVIALLQSSSGVAINTEVPIWGVFVVIIAAVAAFAALKSQMASHEKADDQRFDQTERMLTEIRKDVKTLLRHPETGGE